ncbi:hypothetical protein BVX98_05520 [bacterium F11]|nr:hypothetical protein BVX98_05520 [bacterium F11]
MADFVICRKCGEKNRTERTYCFSCYTSLENIGGNKTDTKIEFVELISRKPNVSPISTSIKTLLWIEIIFGALVIISIFQSALPSMDPDVPEVMHGVAGGAVSSWMNHLRKAGLFQVVLLIFAGILLFKNKKSLWGWYIVLKGFQFVKFIPAAIVLPKGENTIVLLGLAWHFVSLIVIVLNRLNAELSG